MASVFLSYDRDDTERARPIAEALESAGHEVWWDLHAKEGAPHRRSYARFIRFAPPACCIANGEKNLAPNTSIARAS